MPIAYSATTEAATFLLDEFGVCRRVLLKHVFHGQHTMGGRTRPQAARAIVGAQYVASIDTHVFGGLVPMPKPGAAMLFAYMGDDGRLAVVRTGPLVKFETLSRPLADDTERDLEYEDYDDDEAMTAPLHQSGERSTPVVSILIEDEWTPPEPPPTWPTLPQQQNVRIQRVSAPVPKSESAPTLRMVDSGGRGRLPRRAGRM